MLLSVKNKHTRDEVITFDEPTHKYYINEQLVGTSVTTFIHSLFPHFDAEGMAEKISNGQCSLQSKKKYEGMSKQDIIDKWNFDGKNASESGTKMHEDIEFYFNDMPRENNSIEYQYFKNFLKSDFMKDLVPYRTEWVVYDNDLDIAGSIDMVFYNTSNKTYEIWDWKRSKGIEMKNNFGQHGLEPLSHLEHCNYWHYSLQLNFYKYLLEKNYGLKISSVHLLVLHPNNKNNNFIEISAPDLSKEVESIVNYRLMSLNKIL